MSNRNVTLYHCFVMIDFNDIEKHTTSGVLCLRDDIRIKMEEKLAEAMECRQIAKTILKRLACK
jgi:hypothetical protein